MFAGKQFDIVMGTDIHLIQPPGPSAPVPVPHPFIGMVFDPPEFMPKIGTILVNGLPRAQAGSNVKCVPPHIPIGGTFVIPPGNDGEVQKGGKSVEAETEPFTYFGAPVLTCNDVGGQSSISRPERHSKSKPKSLIRATSVLLPVPKGFPVVLESGVTSESKDTLEGGEGEKLTFVQLAPILPMVVRPLPPIVVPRPVPPIVVPRPVPPIVVPELGAKERAKERDTGLVEKSPKPDDEDPCKNDHGEIEIPDADKIPRDELDPPKIPGNAPTFKQGHKYAGQSVEIHHHQQNPQGPFKELSRTEHRGKDYDAENHPNKQEKSKICREKFAAARRTYWKKEYFKK